MRVGQFKHNLLIQTYLSLEEGRFPYGFCQTKIKFLKTISRVASYQLFTTLPDTQVVAINSWSHCLISGLLYGLSKTRLTVENYRRFTNVSTFCRNML